jgi:hypothetical protein
MMRIEFDDYLLRSVEDAIITYTRDLMRYTEEQLNNYMVEDYNNHLGIVYQDWITYVYEDIMNFDENQIKYTTNDNFHFEINLDDKLDIIFEWCMEDLERFQNNYFTMETHYLILDTIFGNVLILK